MFTLAKETFLVCFVAPFQPIRVTCHLKLPGSAGFPLRAFFSEPAKGRETGAPYKSIRQSITLIVTTDDLRAYLAQLRMEVGNRMAKRIIDPVTKRPSKVDIASVPCSSHL